MSENNPQNHKASSPKVEIPPWLKWVLRTLLLFGAYWLAFQASKDTVSRAADATSVIFTIGAFYIATVEPEILGWLIERARVIYKRSREKTKKIRKTPRSEGRSDDYPIQIPDDPLDGQFQTSASTEIFDDRGSSDSVEAKASRNSSIVLLAISVGIALLFVGAYFVAKARYPQTSKPVIAESLIDDEDTPEFNRDATSLIEGTAPEHTANFVRVRTGDTCFSIAEACTGDGERFIELGAPVNDWLDVSNRRFCLIHPNDEIILPESWGASCGTGTK